jgi:hypothetical protein
MTDRLTRRIAGLMAVVAATLVVASALHLSGATGGRSRPFDPDRAGVSEAIIAVVLAAGAVAMVRLPHRARTIGVAVNGFATVGFLIGLSITASGGHLPDIAYHVIVLPFLIGSVVVLLTARPGDGMGGATTAPQLRSADAPARSLGR